MTREEAEIYARNMSYEDALFNLTKARAIPYKKATLIKVYELIQALEQEPTDENLHREREQAYMQGYEDASKRFRQEPCEKCKYFDGNSCQHYDYKVGYTQGYEDASKRFRQETCEDAEQ